MKKNLLLLLLAAGLALGLAACKEEHAHPDASASLLAPALEPLPAASADAQALPANPAAQAPQPGANAPEAAPTLPEPDAQPAALLAQPGTALDASSYLHTPGLHHLHGMPPASAADTTRTSRVDFALLSLPDDMDQPGEEHWFTSGDVLAILFPDGERVNRRAHFVDMRDSSSAGGILTAANAHWWNAGSVEALVLRC